MSIPHSEPLAAVITRHHGPPEPRIGDRSRRLWWVCPFHEDSNPSLCVAPGEDRYRCFGCSAHGDAIDFVRRLNPGMTFAEARAAVGAGPPPGRGPRPPRPEGWPGFAARVVADAEASLWSGAGARARRYLHGRGLDDATIRAARLGHRPADAYPPGPFADKPAWLPRGIVIPWLDGDQVEAINVRRPPGAPGPKYVMVRGSRRGIYPGRGVIARGRPLILVEGEFEALLLKQELNGLAPAVTLGSAGDRPDAGALSELARAAPWLVAVDADAAGRKSAEAWLARSRRCRRIEPPGGFKDWTEAHQAGVELRRWWGDVLAGDDNPRLFTWEELARKRWGPAAGGPTGRRRPVEEVRDREEAP